MQTTMVMAAGLYKFRLAGGRAKRRAMAAGNDADAAILLGQSIQIVAAIDLAGERAVGRAGGIHRPVAVAMPVLLVQSRLRDAAGGAMELDAGSEHRLHPLEHGRMIEEKTKALILLEKVVVKFLLRPRVHLVRGHAKLFKLRGGDGVFDDEVAPLHKEGDFPLQLRRQFRV